MNKFSLSLCTFLFISGLSFSPAHALEVAEYSDKAVTAEKAKGNYYAFHFFAEWCSICQGQKNVLKSFESDPALKDMKVFLVDFDLNKALKKEFRVERQSTIVVFRRAEELTRSLGLVEKEKLLTFLKKNL